MRHWTSVKDELPCEGARVLVEDRNSVSATDEAIFKGGIFRKQMSSGLRDSFQEIAVTHWTSFPRNKS